MSRISKTQTQSTQAGRALVGLTLGLMLFEQSAAPVLANGAANWQPMAAPMHTNPVNHATSMPPAAGWQINHSDIGKSQGSLQLVPHALLNRSLHSFSAAPVFAAPHVNLTTTELGQSGHNLSLDLTSATANIVLGSRVFNGQASVAITADGATETFKPGATVTAAQYIAIQQVLSTGKQAIIVSANGAASGGDFSLNAIGKNTGSLVVPTAVTAIDTVTRGGNIHLSGDLTNYGSVEAIAANNRVTSGTISAMDIVNEAGAMISASSTNPAFALNLVASNNIVNSGTIKSTGDVNLSTGSGNLTNSGMVSAGHNVNISSPNASSDINVNGTGGTISAVNGDINIRDKSYNGAANVNLNGGNYLSQNLNIYSGSGAITGVVGQLSGKVNTVAAVEHLSADTDNLILGNNKVDGDPTFASTGDITISGVNSFSENVAILAQGNITADASGQIVAQGHDITLIAGATVTTSGTKTTTISGDGAGQDIGSGFTATADLGTPTGGNIDLRTSTSFNPLFTASGSGNAGNITLVALAKGSIGGTVSVSQSSDIFLTSSGGKAGNLTVIASANPTTPTTTVNLGFVDAMASDGSNGGSVQIYTNNPTASQVTFNNKGVITGGSITPQSTSNTTFQNAGVTVQTINTQVIQNTSPLTIKGGNGGSVTIISGGAINELGAISTYGGSSTTLNGGDGGNVYLLNNTGNINFGGGIDARGGGGGGGKNGNGGNITVKGNGDVMIGGSILSVGNTKGTAIVSGRTISFTGAFTNIDAGNVIITTASNYISPVYLADADYSGTTSTNLAITAGPIYISNSLNGTNISINGAPPQTSIGPGVIAPPSSGTISITESGKSVPFANGNKVTSSEYVALVQQTSSGIQTLVLTGTAPGTGHATGGSFTIASQNIPTNYSGLVLPTGVTANVTAPVLNVQNNVNVSGSINFTAPSAQFNVAGNTTASGAINFNGAQGGALVSGGFINIGAINLGKVNGSTTTLIAGGDVTFTTAINAINNSGNLTVVAGAGVVFNGDSATFTGASAGGKITTSGVITGGGDFTAVAYNNSATPNAGLINDTGIVSTSAASSTEKNGNVVLISQLSNISVSSTIMTSGVSLDGNAGNITALSTTPVITGGIATIANGALSPTSTFSTSQVGPVGGTIIFSGNVIAAGAGGSGGGVGTLNGAAGGKGGSVTLAAGAIAVSGSIEAFGGGGGGGLAVVGGSVGSAGGNGGNGGAISITANTSVLVTSDLNSSGGGGGAAGGLSTAVNHLPGSGGSAGNINVYSNGSTLLVGVVLAVGGGSAISANTAGGGSLGGGGGGSGNGTNTNGGGGSGTFGGGAGTVTGGGGGGGGYLGSGGGGGGITTSSGGGGGGNGTAGTTQAGGSGLGLGGNGIAGGGNGGMGNQGGDGGSGGSGSGIGAGPNNAGGASGSTQGLFGIGGNGGAAGFAPIAGDTLNGGNGGQVAIAGQSVRVNGQVSANSALFKGLSIVAAGNNGSITIDTQATSVNGMINANADYSSTTRSIAAPQFSGSAPVTIIGTTGSGTTGGLSASTKTVNGTPITFVGVPQMVTSAVIALPEQSGIVTITPTTLLTPAENVAALQIPTGLKLVLNNGAAVGGTIDFTNMTLPQNNTFISLGLPVGVTLVSPSSISFTGPGQIDGSVVFTNPDRATLSFADTLNITGSVSFTGSGSIQALNTISISGTANAAGTFLAVQSFNGPVQLTGNALLTSNQIQLNGSSLSLSTGAQILAQSAVQTFTSSIANDGVISGPTTILNSTGGLTLSGAGQIIADNQFQINASGDVNLGNFLTSAQSISTNQLSIVTPGILTIATNSLAVTADGSGNGGSITISADSLVKPAGPLALNADGNGTGRGGAITVQLNGNSDVTISSTGTFTASANGGGTSGNGGSINFITGGNLTVDQSALHVVTQGGNGGSLNLSSTDALTLIGNQLNVNGVSGGAGGMITLAGDTIVTSNGGALVLNASGDASGNGGHVNFITTSTTNSILLDSSATPAAGAVSINATGGNGGQVYVASGKDLTFNSVNINPNGLGTGDGAQINIQAATGTLTFGAPNFQFDGVGNGNGGTVQLNAMKVVLPTSAGLDLSASAASAGSGAGGSINLTTPQTTPLVFGTGVGTILLTAKAGTDVSGTGENGGFVSITTGGSIAVHSGGISADAGATGNGGEIDLVAGTGNAGGTIQIAGNLDVSGKGSGTAGGQISLVSNSKTAFSIGLAKAVNGTQGILSAGGTAGPGSIIITNNGTGGITQLQAFTALDTLRLQTQGGAIALNNNIGPAVTNVFVFSNGGKVSSTSKAIIEPSQITINSKGGAISLPNLQAKTVTANTGASAAVAITNPGANPLTVQGISGGTVTIKSLGNLTFAGPVTGGNVTITNTNKNGGAVALNSVITSSGILSVSTVGSITSTGTINATKGVKFAATGAISTISQAASISVGSAGSISVVAAKSTAANTIDFTGSDLNGGKTVTLTATKGSIITDTIGDVTAPGVIKVTAANTIDNQGQTTATTSITEKTTGSLAGNGITVEGSMQATLTSKGVISLSAAGTGAKIFEAHGMDIGATKSVTIAAAKGSLDLYNVGVDHTPLTVSLTAANLVQTDGVVHAVNTITEKGTAANSSVIATGGLTADGASGTITISAVGGGITGIGLNGPTTATKAVTLTTPKGVMVVSDVTTGVFKATTYSLFAEQFGANIIGRTGVTIAATSKDNTASMGIVLSGVTTGTGSTTAGGAISIKSAGVPILLNGDANLSANSGKSTKATVTIENALTTGSGGTITLAPGAQISTGGTFGSNVILSIGAPPSSPKFGTLPTGQATYTVNGTAVTPSATGPFYFGSGTTGTVNFLNATADPTALQINSMGGGKVIFSTGNLPAANITVNAGTAMVPTIITADPPVFSQAVVLHTAIAPTLNIPAISTTSNISVATALYTSDAVDSNVAVALPSNVGLLKDNSATIASPRPLFSNASVCDAPLESRFIGSKGSFQSDIDAKIVGVGDGNQTQTLELRQGNMVFAPKQDATVETPFGQVVVKAGAIALILVEGRSTAVYNLHDERRNSIVIISGGEKITLSPGRHVMITSSRSADFKWINPAEAFAYRNVSSKTCAENMHAFTTEFSLMHALANVRQLKELVASKQPESLRTARKLLKTAAIVSQYGPRGGAQTAYQTYQHPQMTASAIR